jgi:signal transduction histidine kinase
MSPPAKPILLLVDDEPDILVALEDLFEESYRIIACTSGEAALARLAETPDVAVIVSDQRMPGMTGDAFLARARKISDASAILLTGYADLSAVTAALNRGGIVGYVPKPWDTDALRAMVAGAARQHLLGRELRKEQALLRGLMEHLPAAVAFKDRDGRFVHLNARKAESLGAAPDAALGRTEQDLGGGVPSPAEAQAREGGCPVQLVSEVAGAAGPAWTETTAVPLTDERGDLQHMLVLERDVTADKLAELQMRQTDKLRALGTLAGGVAHDFNNLLTAILGSLELATRRISDEKAVGRYLDNAAHAAQKGAALTKRLLGFSRQTDGEPEVVDLAVLLPGARELLARTLGASATLEWRANGDLWPVTAETDQLELALLNLVVNARDASPEGGLILIEAENARLAEAEAARDLKPGDYVRITVSDRGHGMSREVRERILEPFFTTKPVGKGTGLGLPMVYGFVQRSGGGMTVDSEPGEGTQISLYLPRAETAATVAPAAPATADRGPAAPAARILVVDDEPAVRDVTVAFLRDLGHTVLAAENAAAALTLLERQRGAVDLAVVDFAMPGMNGVELAEAARRLQPNLPVILLTGYFDVDVASDDLVVMQKPFTNAVLRDAIARIMSECEAC